ncbi:MAG: polyhydroxyalkanoic acid system family protein [Myxococcales bacterium]
MKFDQSHALGKDEAKKRIERLADYWKTKYGVAVNWNGDSARLVGAVKGINFDATLTVRDTLVDAEGTDPGLLMRAVATAYLKKKLAVYLDPAVKPESIVE